MPGGKWGRQMPSSSSTGSTINDTIRNPERGQAPGLVGSEALGWHQGQASSGSQDGCSNSRHHSYTPPARAQRRPSSTVRKPFQNPLDTFLLLSHWPELGHMFILNQSPARGVGVHDWWSDQVPLHTRSGLSGPDHARGAGYHLKGAQHQGPGGPCAFSLF